MGQSDAPAAVHERLALSIYAVEISSYEKLALHDISRRYWVMSYVHEGALETRTGRQRFPVRAGDVMIHPPLVPFSEVASGPGTHYWFEFEFQVEPQIELLRLLPVSYLVRPREPRQYADTFERLRQAWLKPSTRVRELVVSALAAELVAQVLETWERAGSPARPDAGGTPRERFREVIEHMMNHLAEKLSRSQLAKIAGLHPAYFDRAFRQVYGVPPLELLRDLRLRKAQELVEGSDAKLEAIAEVTGLGDAAYLSRVFRGRFGCAPGQHRENVKGARQGYMPEPRPRPLRGRKRASPRKG